MVSAFNMPTTLVGRGGPCFSETAGPHPCHREARGYGGDGAALAVRAGGLADDVAEGPAERSEAREADVHADVRHRAVALPQQQHRALYPAALQVAVRRLAERGPEGADEMR